MPIKNKKYKRKCLNCKQKFDPMFPNSVVCSPSCGVEYVRGVKAKEWSKEKKVRKEKLKTRKDHLNDLQKLFNKYIRLRDAKKGCISCGKELVGKYDAGHMFSVGAYPALRFNEWNNNGQCVRCNRDLHGNIGEYMIRLPQRIGNENFEALKALRMSSLKLTLPEILELGSYYKQKIKEIKT
jgi:predicted RNA-binding Zn-ribbon protein involved in translation (DUF1610 family)